MMLESLMQLVWGFLGACSGVFIGLTKEGTDLFSSLGSVQGWKQIYTGTAAVKSKKIDNNKSSTRLSSHGATGSEQTAVKQFLGTRSPESKPAQQRAYSNFPILGRQDASPAPTGAPMSARPSPVKQPDSTPHTNAPVPFSMPAGTGSQAVRADSLDIFGSTSLTGGKPAAQPVLASTPAPAVIASPVKGAAVGNSPNSPAQQEEPYVSDGASTPDDGNSPEAVLKADSRMKKLSKRISSKLRSPKA